jgi:hypothetical protein
MLIFPHLKLEEDMRALFLCLVLAVFGFPQHSHAQEWVSSLNVHGVPLSCTSSGGTLVPLKATEEAIAKGGGGFASLDPIKGPSILLSPSYLATLPRIGAFFLFYHECAHVALPFGIGLGTASQEANADCYAVKEMRGAGLIESWSGFSEAVTIIKGAPQSSKHLPGSDRIAAAAKCAKISMIGSSNGICRAVETVLTGGNGYLSRNASSVKGIVPGFSCELLDAGKRLRCSRFYGEDSDRQKFDARSVREELGSCMPEDFAYRPPASGFFGWTNSATGQSIGVSTRDEWELSFDITP